MTQYPYTHMLRLDTKSHEAMLALIATMPTGSKSAFIRNAVQTAIMAQTEKAPSAN
jgi:hypothetical protein